VTEVKNRYNKALFRCPDVVGFGIGRDNQETVLTVYLARKDKLPSRPLYLEGVRLHFVVTGTFHSS
jgi:hypothetical protein